VRDGCPVRRHRSGREVAVGFSREQVAEDLRCKQERWKPGGHAAARKLPREAGGGAGGPGREREWERLREARIFGRLLMGQSGEGLGLIRSFFNSLM
jgi:hypothetical protein